MKTDMLLEVNNLTIKFDSPAGEIRAVNDVSFSLKKGETLGIVGESGSGKSVLAHSIMGLLPKNAKSSGSVKFNSTVILGMPDKLIRNIRGKEIGIIFQDPTTSLNPVLTIGAQIKEVITLHKNIRNKQAQEQVYDLLTKVGISDAEKRAGQYPHELSGGMCQRVMIAMAVACEPALLIADEPTSSLDVTIQMQILKLIKEIQERTNMSLIMISHNIGVASDFCDRVSVMYGGRIVESGKTSEILESPVNPYTVGLFNCIPCLNGQTLKPIEGSLINLNKIAAGCPFAPRCGSCMTMCLTNYPPELSISGDHKCSCWLNFKKVYEGNFHE
ncbi:MAG: ABC transporter ATP-binding protein [Bacillota bacterium]|nr:ABC transporter ATP-binding protein [Bacillota bacterium]